MLHPNQFKVNEAWIAFKLNNAPIQAESDGLCNCFALMDAASCFILSSTIVPASEAEPSKMETRGLLKQGRAHKKKLPKTLFIPSGQFPTVLAAEAETQRITVVRVSEDQLFSFIGDARATFSEHFGV